MQHGREKWQINTECCPRNLKRKYDLGAYKKYILDKYGMKQEWGLVWPWRRSLVDVVRNNVWDGWKRRGQPWRQNSDYVVKQETAASRVW
jgi:hypothetical protein